MSVIQRVKIPASLSRRIAFVRSIAAVCFALQFIAVVAAFESVAAEPGIVRLLDATTEEDGENAAGESSETPDRYVDVAAYGSALTVFWENDVIYGKTDQYYTNGTRLEYASLYDWRKYKDPVYELLPEIARANGVFIEDGWVLAQNMYSPTNIARSDVSYGDRPYAGWTYLGKRYGISKERSYHSFELDLGGVGPVSQGKSVQTWVHEKLTGSPTPHWGNQIPNFFAVRANYYYSRPVTPAQWQYTDIAPYLDLNLGNVLTSASLGFTWRLGYLDSREGHLPLERGVGRVDDDTFELYLFVRPEGTGVALNSLLSGAPDANNRTGYSNNGAAEALAYDSLARRVAGSDAQFTYPGYYSLIENDGVFEPNTRFFVFDQNLGQRITNPGTKYLVYNTLFQGGETIDETIRLSVLYSALQDPQNTTDPLRTLWLLKTVGRKPGDSLDPAAKFLAYRILTEGAPADPLTDFFVYYTLLQKHDPRKTYTIGHRPFVGGLRTGVVLNYGRLTILTAIAIRSAEFYQKGFLPEFHKWFTLQATVRF